MPESAIYLEGRPFAHPLHRRFAEAVCDKVEYIDPVVRWQDRTQNPLKLAYAWIRNAWALRKICRDYDIILVDNLHFTPVLMNLLLGKRRRKKLIVHLGSHTLYFLLTHRFSKMNEWLHRKALASYDVLFCEGHMAADFVDRLGLRKTPVKYVTFLGPPARRQLALTSNKPDLESGKILIIANGPTEFRMFYKGLDLMFEGLAEFLPKYPSIKVNIAGEWEQNIQDNLLQSVPEGVRNNIIFLGKTDQIPELLRSSAICLHCSRGDAFPTSTIECMMAGIPVIVSDMTGTMEIVSKANPQMVIPAKPAAVNNALQNYFQLSPEARIEISTGFREASRGFTEEKAVEHYILTFEKARSEWD